MNTALQWYSPACAIFGIDGRGYLDEYFNYWRRRA
jgi:hypothetical protein